MHYGLARRIGGRGTRSAPSGLLALAYDQGVEADLAVALDAILDAGGLPDLADLRTRFMPASAPLPSVQVEIPGAASYDRLLSATAMEMAA